MVFLITKLVNIQSLYEICSHMSSLGFWMQGRFQNNKYKPCKWWLLWLWWWFRWAWHRYTIVIIFNHDLAACNNGHFFCKNKGHIEKTILSSHVNDGICGICCNRIWKVDCCDGSDEYNGFTKCPNSCEEDHRIWEYFSLSLLNPVEKRMNLV